MANINETNKNSKNIDEKIEKVVGEWFNKEGKQEEKEKIKFSEEEKTLKKELEEKIAKMEIPPTEIEKARKEIEKMQRKTVEGKIKHLLQIAATKGLSLAIATANATGDPFLIDTFHDILSKNGLFKEYLKKK
ncbi:hypothetical protein J7J81_00385 [bacterium]|nr:hypothetical protein [bacterium]